eukprot:scaffold30467_cov101-Isochrysis_galbana.AAC.1
MLLDVAIAHGAPAAAANPSGEKPASSVLHGSMMRHMPSSEQGSDRHSTAGIASPSISSAATAVATGCSPTPITDTMAVGSNAEAITCRMMPVQPITPRMSSPNRRWPSGEMPRQAHTERPMTRLVEHRNRMTTRMSVPACTASLCLRISRAADSADWRACTCATLSAAARSLASSCAALESESAAIAGKKVVLSRSGKWAIEPLLLSTSLAASSSSGRKASDPAVAFI